MKKTIAICCALALLLSACGAPPQSESASTALPAAEPNIAAAPQLLQLPIEETGELRSISSRSVPAWVEAESASPTETQFVVYHIVTAEKIVLNNPMLPLLGARHYFVADGHVFALDAAETPVLYALMEDGSVNEIYQAEPGKIWLDNRYFTDGTYLFVQEYRKDQRAEPSQLLRIALATGEVTALHTMQSAWFEHLDGAVGGKLMLLRRDVPQAVIEQQAKSAEFGTELGVHQRSEEYQNLILSMVEKDGAIVEVALPPNADVRAFVPCCEEDFALSYWDSKQTYHEGCLARITYSGTCTELWRKKANGWGTAGELNSSGTPADVLPEHTVRVGIMHPPSYDWQAYDINVHTGAAAPNDASFIENGTFTTLCTAYQNQYAVVLWEESIQWLPDAAGVYQPYSSTRYTYSDKQQWECISEFSSDPAAEALPEGLISTYQSEIVRVNENKVGAQTTPFTLVTQLSAP